MVEQPSGTVTLVFTDIEGSTRLLHELGEQAYRGALAEHRRIVRKACGRYGGYEVDYEGDSFFYAFRSAGEAVGAIEQAMQGLADAPIRLRVGVHTGEPGLDPPKYVGLDVHRAARIMSAGHGGQVLLSSATAALVEQPLRELGEHRLKDFAEPVPLFQLGSERFPPLRTISNTNLPRPASSFIGRERELWDVVALLRDGSRLVTLEGPGGSGKTRLAIEAAAELVGEFKAGVFWVRLAGLREASLVLATIGQVLGAKDELARHIEHRELLLLLDNFEQVVEASPEVSGLVEACPNLRVLVTSRELLRVRGEVRYEVPPLEPADAVTLFCARAQLEGGPEIVELCRRLDELPLAVELAAARTTVLSPGQILERIGERLDLFRGGRDAESRQQTLRATIEWSYDLLSEEEQRLFARLAIFAGGCTLEAAEQVTVAELDVLQSLVEKSLVRHSGGRFWMLETVREYAVERLEASEELERLRREQAEFLLRLAHAAGFAHDSTTPERLDLVKPELANIREALAWAVESDVDAGIELMGGLEMFWMSFDNFEAQRWSGALVELTRARTDPFGALALRLYGSFLWLGGDYEDGYQYMKDAFELYEQLGDAWNAAVLAPRLAVHLNHRRDDRARARQLCERSLAQFQQAGFTKGQAEILEIQSYIESSEGRYERALELTLEAERLSEQVGWKWWRVGAIRSAAEYSLELGRLEEAATHARRALLLSLELGTRTEIAEALQLLAVVAAKNGEEERAGLLFGAVEAESERSRLGQWEAGNREATIDELSPVAGPEFEHAVMRGKTLTLDAAAELILQGISAARQPDQLRQDRRRPAIVPTPQRCRAAPELWSATDWSRPELLRCLHDRRRRRRAGVNPEPRSIDSDCRLHTSRLGAGLEIRARRCLYGTGTPSSSRR
jgi:predicted ATPase